MEAAVLVAIVLSNGEGHISDRQDFAGIVLLSFINSTIDFYEERNAAVEALMDSLAPNAKLWPVTVPTMFLRFSCQRRYCFEVVFSCPKHANDDKN
ncbi:hypothetical protein VKT23_009971 [Stygiomarasmius scandens]|uniref:Uncharacterized protein n=1 Tax=Marasmiellus scandens TaxID=2682957 RepID=A0ABR1JCN9_9AGAR